jgi:hypothetical protein
LALLPVVTVPWVSIFESMTLSSKAFFSITLFLQVS